MSAYGMAMQVVLPVSEAPEAIVEGWRQNRRADHERWREQMPEIPPLGADWFKYTTAPTGDDWLHSFAWYAAAS